MTLIDLWKSAYREVEPDRLILPTVKRQNTDKTALLFWGKSALPSYEAVREAGALPGSHLVISPDFPRDSRWIQGEHPFPGEGSFAAGREILEFFGSFKRFGVEQLEVYLSGGASSLAWLPYPGMSRAALLRELEKLYSSPLSIRELNAARARLCQLKAGGTARWLNRLAPRVRARVQVICDTRPWGAEVVGGGPFWNGSVSHRILADNGTLVAALAREARARRIEVLASRSGWIADWAEWVSRAFSDASAALRAGRRGLLIYGGEPRLRLPREAGRGGRQTQIAAALAARAFSELVDGRIEILAMSSDGCDGRSGAAGAFLNKSRRAVSPRQLQFAAERFDAATLLGRCGALVPADDAATKGFSNVQDVLIVYVNGP